ncbi:DUF4198 domain-containing protein [Testudinibacter sp. TR-2022]|uniref:DUF4198 domain-containing protein n=1 Tax=Testudinibacter sp. TR-2022 TaxID=2585029 RepID=UPI001119E985|nr:DUF4198 domain-containing protein [Testudinibacter sp. TR-2022]TNH04404.1 DUF4198 domain-containing protein [Pasteurellaceae bacterium Phil11]TNH19275.1 DUF4198 domain-containing protein [Testudinibacter sp. TR-2022]TNH24010.1 DUF4198 domain-containing protein [Testudinibacter sp. TR-2022]
MKKVMLTALCALSASSLSQAHDLWVYAQDAEQGKPLQAVLGYGDNFPAGDPIPEKRLHIFPPLELVTPNKTEALQQQGENYHYVSPQALSAGEYKISSTYRPTFWSKNAEGWKMQNLSEVQDAHYCEQSSMYATTYFNLGGAKVSEFAQKPVGLELEIVPLVDPSQIKPMQVVPVQVLYNGEPVKGATIIGTADTLTKLDWDAVMDHREPQAFSGKTDKNGVMNFIPLLQGNWKLKTSHEAEFPDQKICQKKKMYSTYTLNIQ